MNMSLATALGMLLLMMSNNEDSFFSVTDAASPTGLFSSTASNSFIKNQDSMRPGTSG